MSDQNTATSGHNPALMELTAEVVAAYISNNSVPSTELPGLLQTTYAALDGLGKAPVEAAAPAKQEPAVSIRKSITDDYLVCLEDGRKFKSLKRHLSTAYGLTPAEYRAKWNLPNDYPMVAPAYAKARSTLAKTMGLGQQRRNFTPASIEVASAPEPAAKRARAKKAA